MRQTLLRATSAALLGVAVPLAGRVTLRTPTTDAVWLHDASVMDKEPVAKTVTLGWEGTRKNFEGLFAATAELKVTQADGPHIQVQGDTAWSMGVAWAGQKLKTGQVFGLAVFEADVLKKQNGHWLLVSHATSVLPPPQ